MSAILLAVRAFTHDRFTFPLPGGHRFPIDKYRLTREAVERLDHVDLCESVSASWAQIGAVHDAEWVRRLRYGLFDRRETAGLGLPWSPQLAVRARQAAGSTIAAARAALDDGVAVALGGGMHHAGRRHGRGFCTVNDVMIAAADLRAGGIGESLLILDLDVHQGDGTAEIAADDDTIVTVSLHGARNYPFTRIPSDLDVDLPDGTDDDAYLVALDGVLGRVLDRSYAIAFVLAGADPWVGDRLGRLALTEDGLAERDRRAIAALRATGTPVCVTLAGGYGDPIEATARIHARTVAVASAPS